MMLDEQHIEITEFSLIALFEFIENELQWMCLKCEKSSCWERKENAEGKTIYPHEIKSRNLYCPEILENARRLLPPHS